MLNFALCFAVPNKGFLKHFACLMYGCELWDFSSKYVAWRKGIRLLWSLPYRTHCNLLPIICDDLPVEYQLHIRFLKSIKSNMSTDNGLVKRCARLFMEGSMSDTRKSLTYICSKYGLSRLTGPNKSNVIKR